MMIVHRSHRMEVLAECLCKVLGCRASSDPFAAEWIVVPSSGMERWVLMQIAETLGVAANLRFLFPAQLVQVTTDAVLQDNASGAWNTERVAWTLVDLWPDLLTRPEFAWLADFLRGTGPGSPIGRREVVLARRLAEVFDRYLVYHRDLILSWNQGKGEPSWQAEAWRAVRSRIGPPDPAERMDRLLRIMASEDPPLEGVPPRLCVFGVSALPPSYLEVLRALGRHREVHLFAFVPSPEWFGDARTPVEVDRAIRRSHIVEPTNPEREVHPLLAAFGTLSRDFQDALVSCEGPDVELRDCEVEPKDPHEGEQKHSMLSWLQRDLLNACLPPGKHPVSPGDNSVRVHACHGPMRQVEVLRDALLALFENDPTLEPRDVLVMTPDIEAYAPLVEAVFGDTGEDAGFPRIPYQITDRSIARENPAASVVSRVLHLARGRVPASEVLDLLALPPLARRFEMTPDDLNRVREYVRQSGIRWGVDKEHRAKHGLPATDEHTWRFGLDRLVVGFAMGSDGSRIFHDVLPCDLAAGGGGGTLPRFIAFCEVLFDLIRCASAPKPLQEWAAFTEKVLERLTAQDDESKEQVLEARRCLSNVVEAAGDGPPRPLDLDAWLAVWEAASTVRSGTTGFFRGGVTFAALVPMRSLPFRVVALMGLDDGAFPRQAPRLSFDLLARERSPRDRSPRDEDLQLFLEAILSARDHLIITYTGLGARDNQPIPPAVPVAQLLDALDASFDVQGCEKASEAVVVRHPLHPFSPRVFSRAEVPAFDHRFMAAARVLLSEERVEHRPRFDRLVSPRREDVIRPEDLSRFLEHPTKFLLRRLGFRPEPAEVSVEDREPVVLEALDRYEVGEEIVASVLLRGEKHGSLLQRLRRAGRLPAGSLAEIEFGLVEDMARPLVQQARTLVTPPIEDTMVDINVGGMRIQGTLPNLSPGGLVLITFSSSFQARLLGLWVKHLLATLAVRSYPGQAVLVSRSDKRPVAVLDPLASDPNQARKCAESVLGTVLHLYKLGQSVPLPLFAKASYAYAEAIFRDRADEALRAAWKSWNDEHGGERADPWVRFAFGDLASPEEATVPNAPKFEELAETVFRPLLEALGSMET